MRHTRSIARRAALVMTLLALPSLAAKPRVMVDAPPEVAKLINKVLAKKYTPTKLLKPLSAQPLIKEIVEATRDLRAIAVIQAQLEGHLWTVQVLNAADGTPLGDVEFKNKKALKPPKNFGPALLAALKTAVAPPLVEAPPPPPAVAVSPTPAAVAMPVAVTPPAVADAKPVTIETLPDVVPETPAQKPLALRLGVGFSSLTRSFEYRDDIFEALSKYTLPFGPAITADGELFPGAFFTSGIGAHFGVTGSFNSVLGVSSKANDVRFATSSLRARASVVGRIPFKRVEFQIGFGWALQTFSIAASSAGTVRPNIPDVHYSGLRPSLQLSFHFSPLFHLHLGGAYQILLSKGELSTTGYFPRSTGAGADLWLGIGIRPMPHFELRLQADYARYFFSMNPQLGDPYIAGGALDQFVNASLTANVVF